MEGDCVFCKIISGEIGCNKIIESDNFLVFSDAHPRSEGHSLVVPKKHAETFLDLSEESYREFLEITKEATEKLLKETNSEGFNLVANNKPIAGQVVPHLHLHILPRKSSDKVRGNSGLEL